MTSSINSVSGNSADNSASTVSKSTLKDSTKKKLEALGISTDGLSEAEAQKLIQSAESGKSEKTKEAAPPPPASESDIMTEAKSLASQVGVSVLESDDTTAILEKIASKINEMIDDVKNDPQALNEVVSYVNQLKGLDSQNDAIQASQTRLNSAMAAMAENNKQEHGLS